MLKPTLPICLDKSSVLFAIPNVGEGFPQPPLIRCGKHEVDLNISCSVETIQHKSLDDLFRQQDAHIRRCRAICLGHSTNQWLQSVAAIPTPLPGIDLSNPTSSTTYSIFKNFPLDLIAAQPPSPVSPFLNQQSPKHHLVNVFFFPNQFALCTPTHTYT